MNIMFSEGGIGLGTFYRYSFSQKVTGILDLSMSESKDDREFEYINPYTGQSFIAGKKNRVFVLPLSLGVQYRIFEGSLTDNLRPYISAGAGPTMVMTTPYEKEFFNAFGDAKTYYALGAYVGFGANFGLSKKSLIGLNVKYHYMRLFNGGVENMEMKKREQLGGFYLTLSIGVMY